MLKLKYNIKTPSERREIVLDDMYVSPDLSVVSGTTAHDGSCVAGSKVTVRSSYFPSELTADIISVDVVRRNGYILAPVTLQVHRGYVRQEVSGETVVVEAQYCEYLGNTYYASSDGMFFIEGSGYTASNSLVTVEKAVHYIEDGKVVIDGTEYNVFINNGCDATFTDSIGEVFIQPSSWEVHATSGGTDVEKIVIGGNTPSVIGCKSARYYGHRGYIVYGDDKKYIQYFTDGQGNVTGAGVIINGIEYSCTDLLEIKDYLPGQTYNIYDITDYYTGTSDRPCMTIDGVKYPIDFEAGEIENSGIICIETKNEYPQVLIDDRIVVKSLEFSRTAMVDTDDMGGRYVYLNRRRHDVISNLCDSVVMDGVEYPITYEYGPSNVSVGTIASALMGDGSTTWLQVDSMERVLANANVYVLSEYGVVNGYIKRTDGDFVSGSTGYCTGLIPVKPNTYYFLSNRVASEASQARIRCLDANESNPMKVRNHNGEESSSGFYIPPQDSPAGWRSNEQFLIPPGAAYLQIQLTTQTATTITDREKQIMLEEVGPDYVPDFEPLPYIEGELVDSDNAQTVKRVYKSGDNWTDAYTISLSGSTASYKPTEPYNVVHHDGILVGEQKLQVRRYEYSTNDGTSAETYTSYEYVAINSMLEYGLRVINTVGSNRILCVPDVDTTLYGDRGIEWLTTEILSSIQGEDFVVQKRSNKFGQRDLYYDTWMTEASLHTSGTSVYELADIKRNIRLFNTTPTFTIPMQLASNKSQKMAYDDLVRSLYCVEEDEKSINPLVDMEKDMYTPVFVSGDDRIDVDAIVFNLHFRTRDLDTWKINVDEGTYTSSEQTVKLSANYQYCNWFVTDYYPFYDYTWYSSPTQSYNAATFNPERFSTVIERSDLLGFMYFTTDDAKVGREKLRKSFLRLTFFDSKDPERQNMLGTSTIFLDCERYMNLLYSEHYNHHYEECYASRNPNRTQSGSGDSQTRLDVMNADINTPTVLTQAFNVTGGTVTTADLYTGDGNVVLDSRIRVENRYNGEKPSEGFYAYILKAFADKTKPKTVYMKAEFFHAGLGIKIPMVLPTTQSGDTGSYSAVTSWTRGIYDDFTNGVELNTVFDRMYVPITIEYSQKERKFVYYIQYEGGYMDSVNKNGREWMLNLFELKTKPQ